MKGFIFFLIFILFITIILPIVLIKGYDILPTPKDGNDTSDKYDLEYISKTMEIEIYDTKISRTILIELDEYIKGVVAAEMPGEFSMEALKAQAVAARTFTLYRMQKYKDGHPNHTEAPLCTGIHCQAYLSTDELREAHGKNWMYEYWTKIEESVETTKGEILTYNDKIIEPLFHSTSGGMTENSEDYFISEVPYLRAVSSPYESDSPKLNSLKQIKVTDFISKIKAKYPTVNLTQSNLPNKIKLMEKSQGGSVMKLMIDNEVVSGRDIRTLFELNSTNFEITLKGDIIEIKTVGYGHGVGMSQWGANGMGENGSTYNEILKHYFTGVEIKKLY